MFRLCKRIQYFTITIHIVRCTTFFNFPNFFYQLHAVFRTQQGRQREPSVKTLRSPLSAEAWRKDEGSNPQPVAFTVTLRAAATRLASKSSFPKLNLIIFIGLVKYLHSIGRFFLIADTDLLNLVILFTYTAY